MSQSLPHAVPKLIQRLGEAKLIGIVRTDTEESAFWASRVLIEAGLRWIEIPFTVPNALHVMEQLSDRYPHAVIGAGTVLEGKEAIRALGAGAQFLVSPVLNAEMIQFGKEHDVMVMPGCMTPTEIYTAWTLGAPAIKFFPAQSVGGAAFISAVRGPLPHIPLVATGGIGLAHVAGYIEAGALAVGVGGPLMPPQDVAARNETHIRGLAARYLEALGLSPAELA
jgi:2-dehydro-3-deoxyphosphogluconate aldolase/(4S)-4-hydroxy-2-oxoglutarate aldolase